MTRQLKIQQPFNLALTLTMGQAFRWRPLGDGWFSGVIGENLIHIRQTDDGVEYRVGGRNGELPDADLDQLLRNYFRDDDDVIGIYRDISRDLHIAQLVKKYNGMRVLRQDPWECLVSYICSRSNSIPNIRHCVSQLSTLNRRTVELRGDIQHIFPPPQRLLAVGMVGLSELDLAGRFSQDFPSAIYAAARRVYSGELDLEVLKTRPYLEVNSTLMQGTRYGEQENNGIGPKISDCVALMSLDQLEAFPVDTHIRRLVHETWFGDGNRLSDAGIVRWARRHLGVYSGYAGQFLFCDREFKEKGTILKML